MKTNRYFKHLIKHKMIALSLILLIATALRSYQLNEQGFLYYDEGMASVRATVLKDHLASQSNSASAFEGYIDSKILWVLCVALGQKLFNDVYAGQIISFLFGILSILLTYKLAKRLYRSAIIGILSAFFLSIYASHVYFSRLALPESTALFFVLGSMLLYLKTTQKRGKTFSALSGALAGISFLLNRYRILLLPLFMLIFEFFFHKNKEKSINKRTRIYGIFILSMILTALSYPLIHAVLKQAGIYIPSYFSGLKSSLSAHNYNIFKLFSSQEYPYFIFHFEGILVLCCILTSFFFIKKRKSPLVPLMIVLAQVLFCSVVDEKTPKNLSIVLPFICILLSVTIYNLLLITKKREILSIATIGLILCLVFEMSYKSWKTTRYKSDLKEAIQWLDKKYQSPFYLTTNLITRIHSEKSLLFLPWWPTQYDLSGLHKSGLRFFLLDPTSTLPLYFHKMYGWDNNYPQLIHFIQSNCTKVKTFPNFNREQMQRAVWAYNRDFKLSQKIISELNDTSGEIAIYDISNCYNKW